MPNTKSQSKGLHQTKIKNLGRVVTGKTPPTKNQEYYGDKYPFITPTDISKNSIFVHEPERYLSEDGAKKVASSKIPKNSVCYTCIASVGKIAITKENSFTNQQINSVIVDPNKDDYRYVFYLLRNLTPQIKGMVGGAASPIINKSAFENIDISILDLEDQRSVANILFTYDDLIENNTKRIKILEGMAQAIYKEWFVYFRFPGHEKIKMIDSKTEFGEIPKGWEIKNLGQVTENYDSKRRPISKMKREEIRGGIPYYGAAKIIDYVNDHIFDGKYLLMAEDGSVITKSGNPVLQFVNEKFWANNHTHILQGVKTSTEYLYLYLSQLPIQGYITGVAQPKINQDNLNRIPVLVPESEIAQKFNCLVESIFKDVWKLKEIVIKLQKARDLLLPKLVTGEVVVK